MSLSVLNPLHMGERYGGQGRKLRTAVAAFVCMMLVAACGTSLSDQQAARERRKDGSTNLSASGASAGPGGDLASSGAEGGGAASGGAGSAAAGAGGGAGGPGAAAGGGRAGGASSGG